MIRRTLQWISLVALSAGCAMAAKATEPNALLGINMSKSGETLGVPLQIVILLTALTLLPAMIMCITPFLRITIVLHFLRQALGTQTTPSNQVLVGIALFLTVLIMSPVAADIYHQAWEPMQNNQMTNYIMPTSSDLPPIRVFFEELGNVYGAYGAKGIGELPMDGPAPAILNAVEDALGIAFDAIPLLPEDIMDRLEKCGLDNDGLNKDGLAASLHYKDSGFGSRGGI